MAKMKVDLESSQYLEITGFSISSDVGWMVVTRLEGKKFHFEGKPVFAQNADKADWPIVDVRRGIVILPPLRPIPHKIYQLGDLSMDKGSEVIENF